MERFSLSTAPLDPAMLVAALRDAAAGALVTFEGWVRAENEGRAVRALEYEAYGTLALKEGERIAVEAGERFAVTSVRCVHRLGRLSVGEAAVWIGVTAAHRGPAFAACSYVIDEVKRRVPIWKKEHYADGASEWTCPGHEARSAAAGAGAAR